jgi:hypothetical protein
VLFEIWQSHRPILQPNYHSTNQKRPNENYMADLQHIGIKVDVHRLRSLLKPALFVFRLFDGVLRLFDLTSDPYTLFQLRQESWLYLQFR